MAKAGDIKYCDLLGGRKTNAVFVYVPPSAFWRGAVTEEDNAVHVVGVSKGFWIQQTELTVEQYNYITELSASGSENSKNPKTEISWTDVDSMISDKPLRLPTEAEWEFAARAGVTQKYLWAGSNRANNVAWTDQNSNGKIHAVANLKSNNYGLYDSSGNVYEWCSDLYSSLSSTPQLDPQGPASGSNRVIRGGHWDAGTHFARVAYRAVTNPDNRWSSFFGVRLVWEI